MSARLTQYLPYLYLAGLTLIVIGLPLGKFFISLGIFLLVFTWLTDVILDSFGFGRKFRQFFKNKPMVLLASIFLIHLIGIFYSENLEYAFSDLRIKLPFLALPVIIAGMKPIKRSGFHFVLKAFMLAVLISTIISYINMINTQPEDVRQGVKFVSHIRLSLMIVLGMAYAWISWPGEELRWRVIYGLYVLWAIYFLWYIEAATGMGILIVLLIISAIYHFSKNKSKKIIGLVLLLTIAAMGVFFLYSYNQYFTLKEDLEKGPAQTINGETYIGIEGDTQIENGYFINQYIAEKELAIGWNERSAIPINGKDKLGQPIKSTLIRYLTSKGLKKDLFGVDQLSDEEISYIENGITNVNQFKQSGFSKRLNTLFFEWNAYKNGANPSGNSAMMRLEFWKTGMTIICDNPLIGVGTGDIQVEMQKAYKESNSILDKAFWKRVHNQYMAFGISFGLLGLGFILYCFLFPYFNGYGNKYAYVFTFIYLMSFLTEDTLETQAGATFVAFFSCFFIQLFPRNQDF